MIQVLAQNKRPNHDQGWSRDGFSAFEKSPLHGLLSSEAHFLVSIHTSNQPAPNRHKLNIFLTGPLRSKGAESTLMDIKETPYLSHIYSIHRNAPPATR